MPERNSPKSDQLVGINFEYFATGQRTDEERQSLLNLLSALDKEFEPPLSQRSNGIEWITDDAVTGPRLYASHGDRRVGFLTFDEHRQFDTG